MRNKSDLVLTGLMIAFFATFVYNLPEAPQGNFQDNLAQNVSTFAGTLAADYNDANPAGTTITTDGLNEIMPAAGDATPVQAVPAPAVTKDSLQAPTPVAQ